MNKVYIVFGKDGFGGESIEGVYSSELYAEKRKKESLSYRVEKHTINKKVWTGEDEEKWASEETNILKEQERHNFGDS